MASKRVAADPPAPPPTPDAPAVETLSIDALVPDAANVRKHGDRNKKVIRRSLAQFGAGRSVVLDGDNVVRAGNGTLEAAAAEGFREVLVVEPRPGQLVAVRRPDWTPAQAVGYAIADNRASELAEWDHDGLAKQLDALMQESDFDASTTGFDDAEIRELVERKPVQFDGDPVNDPASEWSGMPGFEHDDLKAVQSIHVHFKTREDVAAFAELLGQAVTDKTRYLWYPPQEMIRYGEGE